MLRAGLFAALAICLFAASLRAQRGGVASTGHAFGSAVHGGFPARSHLGGQPGRSDGSSSKRGITNSAISSRDRRNDGFSSAFLRYDLPYYGPETDTAEETGDRQMPEPQEPSELQTAERPLPRAQVIEVPRAVDATTAKALPPTIFVLTNGERLETQRFLLTASTLSVTARRTERRIPVEMVDLDATEAANRERGIDLRIPADRNEISLRF